MNFTKQIQNWYRSNRRELPWRSTKDPYLIWLSEVILQQTRIDQGTKYFQAFAQTFPSVFLLANAPEDQVLKLWQGLGYYSRARNLHQAAKTIATEYNGEFPKSYSEIVKLRGVGPYTAAAIASIAFDEPVAVVDGNVYRFLSRYFAIDIPIDSTEGRKFFLQQANGILERKKPGEWNQAIMEIGSLVCTPRNPKCENCPVSSSCASFLTGAQDRYPVKSKKIKVKKRRLLYFVFICKDQILMRKRGENDIWKGLYEFPQIESPSEKDEEELCRSVLTKSGFGKLYIVEDQTLEHILTHQKITARFITIVNRDQDSFKKISEHFGAQPVALKSIGEYAIPKLLENALVKSVFPFIQD